MLKSWGLTSWKKWRISPVTSDWVCLPQFPYHMKFRSMQFSYNFLYLYIHFLFFFWIPLCPIYIVIHLGAAQYNHNLTTDHWAALLEWLGIRCFAQGQLVAFGRQETISYLTSPPPPPQPFFFHSLLTAHSTSYFPLFLSTSTSKRFCCICGKDSDSIHQHCKGHAPKSL